MKFWIRILHLFGGRLAIAIVRNDVMSSHMGHRPSVRFEREADLGWFLTFHASRYFLNVDWV